MDETPATNATEASETGAAPATPVLRVVSPEATPEEIAALVAVFSALGGSGAPAPRPKRSAWSDPARAMRGMMAPGSGAWRASALPR